MSQRVVWKFTLKIKAEVTDLLIPEGARFLHCGAQNDTMSMWFEIPEGSPRVEKRTFRIYGTGDASIEEGASYVGTGIFADGAFVFHVYEVSYE